MPAPAYLFAPPARPSRATRAVRLSAGGCSHSVIEAVDPRWLRGLTRSAPSRRTVPPCRPPATSWAFGYPFVSRFEPRTHADAVCDRLGRSGRRCRRCPTARTLRWRMPDAFAVLFPSFLPRACRQGCPASRTSQLDIVSYTCFARIHPFLSCVVPPWFSGKGVRAGRERPTPVGGASRETGGVFPGVGRHRFSVAVFLRTLLSSPRPGGRFGQRLPERASLTPSSRTHFARSQISDVDPSDGSRWGRSRLTPRIPLEA